MRKFHRQSLALLAMLLLSGQMLAGPLLVCEDMKTGPATAGIPAGQGMAAGEAHGHHERPQAHAHDHRQPGQDVQSPQAGTDSHMGPDGHHCQYSCGLCLISTPFLTFSDEPAVVTARPPGALAPQTAVLPLRPDTPFRPPIFA